MEVVLGVSVAPESVRLVLVEGVGAGGVSIDHRAFEVGGDSSARAAAEEVVAAIEGTRDSAAQGGYRLASSGVTCTDPARAAALRDALSARSMGNVVLVSAVTAAAALAQAVGSATNWARTALLLVEPGTATLALVDTRNGSVTGARRYPLPDGDDAALARLATVVSGAESLDVRPDGVLLVGCEVDIPTIKPTLDAATSLSVMTPEEPDMALARGASLAAANARLGAPRTLAMPSARFDPTAAPQRAYSTADADAPTGSNVEADAPQAADARGPRGRRTVLAVAAVTLVFVVGVVALALALTVGVHPHSDPRPDTGRTVVAPAPPPQNPAPPASPPAAAPPPQAPPASPQPTPHEGEHQRFDDWLHRHLGQSPSGP